MSPAIEFILIMLAAVIVIGALVLIASIINARELASLADVRMTDDDLPPFMRRVENDDTRFTTYDLLISLPRLPQGTLVSTDESRHLANPKNLNLN